MEPEVHRVLFDALIAGCFLQLGFTKQMPNHATRRIFQIHSVRNSLKFIRLDASHIKTPPLHLWLSGDAIMGTAWRWCWVQESFMGQLLCPDRGTAGRWLLWISVFQHLQQLPLKMKRLRWYNKVNGIPSLISPNIAQRKRKCLLYKRPLGRGRGWNAKGASGWEQQLVPWILLVVLWIAWLYFI